MCLFKEPFKLTKLKKKGERGAVKITRRDWKRAGAKCGHKKFRALYSQSNPSSRTVTSRLSVRDFSFPDQSWKTKRLQRSTRTGLSVSPPENRLPEMWHSGPIFSFLFLSFFFFWIFFSFRFFFFSFGFFRVSFLVVFTL